MQVVYLGGDRNGQSRSAIVGYDKYKLDWSITVDKPYNNVIESGLSKSYLSGNEKFTYNLRLITRNQVQKFFYVLDSLETSEINELSSEFWDEADVVGYVF